MNLFTSIKPHIKLDEHCSARCRVRPSFVPLHFSQARFSRACLSIRREQGKPRQGSSSHSIGPDEMSWRWQQMRRERKQLAPPP